MQAKPAIPNLLTVRQFSERYPAFSQGCLRQLIFYSQARKTSHGEVLDNGLSKALVRIGRRVLIDETRFFEWLDSRQDAPASPRTLR